MAAETTKNSDPRALQTSTLRIKVIPRASSNAVMGWLSECREELSLKVTAPAEGGKANAAIIKLLADELSIPKSAIKILRGATSQHKHIALAVSPEALSDWLKTLV